MGRGRSRNAKSSDDSSQSILAEARKLKQQAERRADGTERVALFEKCAQLFEFALRFPLSPHVKGEALFDLGEVFLLWSNAVKKDACLRKCSILKGNMKKNQATQLQLEASICAAGLCRQSFEAFEKVSSIEGSELEQESTINSGNALCDWGELVSEIPTEKGGGISLATDLYAQADNRYSKALVSGLDDIELLTNLGDCCIKRGELAFAMGGCNQTEIDHVWASAKLFYEQAFSTYANACSRADARLGDDLAGLLQNWGAGLLSLAERTPDITEAIEAVTQAEEKLRNAVNLSPTDISIHIALGELFSVQADRFSQYPGYQPQVGGLLEKAINEGYGAALRIDSNNSDAVIGLGEVHFTLARHSLCSGDSKRARDYSFKSLQWYMKAVNLLEADFVGKCELSFEECCDLLYNMACAGEMCGQENAACRALTQLVQIDGMSPAELAEDPELESLRNRDWFKQFVNQKLSSMQE